MDKKYRFSTKCVQSGYDPKNSEPRVLPIYQSTTYKYASTEEVGDLFDLKAPGHMYTRISNPTFEAVENKIADLEGGVGAMLTSSGQAAVLALTMNLCKAGENFLASSEIYGGSINLMSAEFSRMGIEVRYFSPKEGAAEAEKLIDDKTRFIYGETIANPALTVFDIEPYAELAHKYGIPLCVDNTFATPYLCRPFEFGADFVIHSTTKYMDGHAATVGGVVVDGGKFKFSPEKFPQFTEPCESYHGLVFQDAFAPAGFISRARCMVMRDLGITPAPMNAFLLNMGLETLPLRMERHCENAMKVAQFLASQPKDKVKWVSYPGLEGDMQNALARKYLKNEKGEFIGAAGVISFGTAGGRDGAARVMDALKLAAIVVHVADARTCVMHPASGTHRQLTDEQLVRCGVAPEMIRFSCGIENADDIIDDLKQALTQL